LLEVVEAQATPTPALEHLVDWAAEELVVAHLG
jgi:hypothetical protein